jgi:NAD(P)-dependent dehydrogenase (short-subunit alcohol dehydrogenase family)
VTSFKALIVGASQGIGYGFVQQLLQTKPNADLYATYRQLSSDSRLAQLADQFPDRLTLIPLEITEEATIAACAHQLTQHAEKLHLLINCVGVLHAGDLQPEKSLRHINADNLTHYFQVNAIGTALLAKHLLPLFRHRERSLFTAISAKVGSIGDNQLGGWYGYRASKAALNMLIRNIAIEYKRVCPHTIVVSLHPGTTDTRLSEPFQKNVPADKLFSIERTVTQLLTVLEERTEADSGQFFSWDGSPLPW